MKKTLLIVLIIIIFIFVCTGFAPKKDRELVFWTLQMGDFSEYINKIIEEYELTHDIKIKWVDVPFSEGEKRTLSAMLSDNPPDLINLNPDFSLILAQKGALTFIDKSFLKNFNTEVVDSLKYSDNIYAIPWYATSAVTFYNTALIDASIKTYEELKTADVKSGSYVFMPTITENDTMLKILNKYGINSYENIASEKSQQVFKLFKDLYDSGRIPKESLTQSHREALEKYMSGQVAIFQGGANFLNMIKENAPDVYNNTVVAPQLKGSLGQNDFSLMNLVVPVKSKNVVEAIDFGLFLTNEENQLELARLTNVIATNKNALKSKFYHELGNLTEEARTVSASQLSNVNPVMRQNRNQKEINLLVNSAVEDIIINNANIEQTLQEVAKKWKEITD